MHVDERLPRSRRLEERVAAGRHLAEAAADRERRDRRRGGGPRCLVHRDAEHADVARRAVVDEVLAAERSTRRAARSPRRTPVRRGSSRPSSRPRRRRRAGARRRREARAGARDPLRAGATRCDLDASAVRNVGLLGEHVLGQGEHDRPGPPGERDRERLGHVLRDPLDAVELPRRLRDAAEDLRVVELLPRLAPAKRARHLADEQDHRRRVLLRGVDADRSLRRARARA